MTRTKRTQDARRTSESRYRRLFETARDGILILDRDTRKITDANPFMVELLGYSRDELLGKELWEIGLLSDKSASQAAFRHLQKTGYVRYQDLPLETRDGGRRDVEFVSNAYEEEGHQVIQCNIRDITERRQIEKEREQLLAKEQAARAEAERLNRMKDEFLADVSHELRTPLMAILSWSTVLRARRLEEADAARAIETIERNAHAQAQLIADILDISRFISGKFLLETRPLELASVVNDAIDTVRLAAEAKAVLVETYLDHNAGLVSGDPNRLRQVVWNLLSNAIKFTPNGGRVEVRLDRVGSDARITVSDTGDGIKADFLPYVFNRFHQADCAAIGKHNGLGLGLAIARQIVEMHGGTIHAESGGEGQGAAFTVRIPLIPLHNREDSTAGDSHRMYETLAWIELSDRTPSVSLNLPSELSNRLGGGGAGVPGVRGDRQ